MKIKITADSTCDLSSELIEKHQIEIVPLSVTAENAVYKDGVDIRAIDIFHQVKEGKAIPRTAAVNAAEYREVFERLLKDYDAIVHINLSSHLSVSHQNACTAAKGLPVYCVDSLNLSTGSGHLVLEACKMAEQDNMTAEAIANALRELAKKVESSFVLDTLSYLHKGGRCTAVAALGANLLKLRPCIEVQEGKMGVGKKYRGSYDRCMRQYVQERLEGRSDIRTNRIFLTHSHCSPETVALVKECIREFGNFDEIIETVAGCTISCHCGPGTLGILFVRK